MPGFEAMDCVNNIVDGVIDLRDVLYFASIIVFFLVLNAAVLESKNES